jgi:hypothetical protein
LLTGGLRPGGPTTTGGLVPPGAGVLGDDFFTDTPGSPVDEDEFPGGTAGGGGSGSGSGGLGHGSYTYSYTLYIYMVMDIVMDMVMVMVMHMDMVMNIAPDPRGERRALLPWVRTVDTVRLQWPPPTI